MRRLLAGTALLAATALPSFAEGLVDMTEAEREAAGKPPFPEEDVGSAFDGWF